MENKTTKHTVHKKRILTKTTGAIVSVIGAVIVVVVVVITLGTYFGLKSKHNKNNSYSTKNDSLFLNRFTKPDLSDHKFSTSSYNNNKQPNPYVATLTQKFKYGTDPIRGVNLGGWLVPEPFIAPSIWETGNNTDTIDIYTLCYKIGRKQCQTKLDEHYDTFLTKADIRKIALLGLDHVRIPIAHWMFDVDSESEPYSYGSFPYLIRALEWCREYGIRVMIDLHTAPGSQNGWNHSGRVGNIKFLNQTDPANNKNLERYNEILVSMFKFFSKPQYHNLITLIGILNEPSIFQTSLQYTKQFYYDTYNLLNNSTNDILLYPKIVLHEGFVGLSKWKGFMPEEKGKNVAMVKLPPSEIGKFPCNAWAKDMDTSMKDFGLTMCGEFSAAINDCGKWLNGVGLGARYDGTFQLQQNPPACSNCTCKGTQDYNKMSKDDISFLKKFVENQMSAFEYGMGWFFWNFKTENNVNPFWDYFLGAERGWIPKDARNRLSNCDYTRQ